MFVIDSTVIFLKKAIFDKMITIPEVIEEIKDSDSRLYLSILDIKVEEAKEEFIERVKEVAKKTGDIYRLSDTDIKLLAKALEYNAVIVTDDYSIQNVAKKLNLKFENVIQKGIEKEFKWIRVCIGCGRRTENEICEICGSPTKLRRVKR